MRTHELVLARVERDLADGTLVLGGRLPGERVLAEQLGVSRPSVREAVRVLEALGVVRTSTGSGPDAGAVLIADPAAGIGATMRLHVATSGVTVREVVQLRLLLEPWAVAEAAAAPRDLATAEALLAAMDDPELAAKDFLELDGAFHATLVTLAGNGLVTAAMSGARGAIRSYVVAGAARLDWPRAAATLRTEHRRILDAVRDLRPDDAARETRAHIERYYRESGVG